MTPAMDPVVWTILSTVAKRDYIGATREDLFRETHGLGYDELEQILLDLEREGHLTIEWLGFNKFIATITEAGSALVRGEYVRRIEEYRKRVEAGEPAAEQGEGNKTTSKGN